ncbi:response regulator [Arcticibacter sp. MXS-1]|uniref:response regulator n=1 Tax=Arcticibacter sp. MXS-1 TaxID=3341726 RepID=UPI0035A8D689
MKKQILVVDDEISILKLLNFVLSKDYELVIKNSGVEAVDWLDQGNDPDLIISDLQMPYFDGSSLVRNLKISGYYRNTPVILLSGVENLEEKVTTMQIKVEGFLQKPFNPGKLRSMIEALLVQSENNR